MFFIFSSEYWDMTKRLNICYAIFAEMVSHWSDAFPDQDSLGWLL
jgi:hypothetical protein